jgi:predicted phosphodiesterase
MTRLWIMSDLHLETAGCAAFVPPADVDHDVVVLAGDVAWSQASSV